MNYSNIMHTIYRKMPSKIRTGLDYILGNLSYDILLGKEYSDTYNMLLKEEFKTRKDHEEYQFKKLKELLIYSYENVPYYRRIFDSNSFDPYTIKKCSDIECLPFLTKDLIEENFDELISTSIKTEYIGYNSTSGTSGHQLRFAYDKRTYFSNEWAYINYLWKRIGYIPGKSRLAALRNDVLPEGELFQYEPKARRWIVDSYHMTSDNIEKILIGLKERNIEFIHTYPSVIYSIAKYMLKTGYKYDNYKIKAIIVTSEMLYDGQKEIIEQAFNTVVYTFYGHSERAALASWCECSTKYHVQSEYGYLEIIDKNGNAIRDYEKMGEIVCTGFSNYAMPLIRYKTADYSSYCKNQACACGRNYVLLNNISGRWKQDVLVGKYGNFISDTALNMHSMIYVNVEKFQFLQEEKGKCKLLIVKGNKYTKEDEEKIVSEVNKKIGDSIDFIIEYVEDIERTKAGKYRYIVRKFDIE